MFNEFAYRVFTTEDERVGFGLTPKLRHLERFLGQPTLAQGVAAANMTRAVDVGIGADLEQIKHLANLQQEGDDIFTPRNLWGIDIKIPDVSNKRLERYASRVTLETLSAQQLQEKV